MVPSAHLQLQIGGAGTGAGWRWRWARLQLPSANQSVTVCFIYSTHTAFQLGTARQSWRQVDASSTHRHHKPLMLMTRQCDDFVRTLSLVLLGNWTVEWTNKKYREKSTASAAATHSITPSGLWQWAGFSSPLKTGSVPLGMFLI